MSLVQHFGFFGKACDLLSEYPPAVNRGTEFEVIFETGDYSPYPIQIPLNDAMRIFWGVKKWKMSFDYDYEINLDSAVNPYSLSSTTIGSYIKTSGKISIVGTSEDENSAGSFNNLHSVDSENKLLCRASEAEAVTFLENWSYPVTYQRRIVTIIDEETGETETIDDTIVENIDFRISNTFDLTQETFVPPFSKTEDNGFSNVWKAFQIQVARKSLSPYQNNINSPVGTIAASFNYLEKTETIMLGSLSPNVPTEAWIVKSEISNVVVEPLEWWTYNGKYDSETGL